MIKSLALTTIVCALNTGGSFNIKPKEVVNQFETKQQATYTSSETYVSTPIIINDDERDINVLTKNTYKYQDNYITTEVEEITHYLIPIYLDSTNEHLESIGNISIVTTTYTKYSGFNQNVNIDNLYINTKNYNNFNDNKNTTYNYNPNSVYWSLYRRYTPSNNTELARTEIKNANTYERLTEAQSQMAEAITTYTDWLDESVQINVNGKYTTFYDEAEQLELGNVIATERIIQTDTPLTLTYEGQLLDTQQKLDNWYQEFNTIIDGENVWNYNAASVDQITINNKFYLSIDTGGQTSPEVIDIGGLMWDIIGMPFTFINQAFNVTLFPGTIYEFNIGTLFKGMIAILAILFVVKLFTRGIDVLGAYTGSAQDTRFKRENQQMKRERHQMDKETHAKEMAKTNKKE